MWFSPDSSVILPVLTLGTLLLVSEHLELVVRQGLDVSGGVMILIASMVVFYGHGQPLGPLLVGAFIAGWLPHIRQHAWVKIGVNSGAFVLATAVATGVMWVIPGPGTSSVPFMIVRVSLGATAYLVTNTLLICYAALGRGR